MFMLYIVHQVDILFLFKMTLLFQLITSFLSPHPSQMNNLHTKLTINYCWFLTSILFYSYTAAVSHLMFSHLDHLSTLSHLQFCCQRIFMRSYNNSSTSVVDMWSSMVLLMVGVYHSHPAFNKAILVLTISPIGGKDALVHPVGFSIQPIHPQPWWWQPCIQQS